MFKATLANRIAFRVAISTTDEIEKEFQKFVSDVQQAAWEATPLLPTKVKGKTYPQEFRNKVAEKREN